MPGDLSALTVCVDLADLRFFSWYIRSTPEKFPQVFWGSQIALSLLEEGFSKCRHTPRPSAWLSTTVASISSGVASALGAPCRHWPFFFAHLFLYGAQTVLPHRSPSEILWLQLFWAHLVLTSSRSLSNAPNRISIGSKLDFMFCANEFKRNHQGSQGLAWPMFPFSPSFGPRSLDDHRRTEVVRITNHPAVPQPDS